MAGNPASPPTPEELMHNAQSQVESLTAANLAKMHWWTKSTTWSALFSPIEDAVDQYLTAVITSTPDADVEKIIRCIKDRREKVSLSTGITDQILGICQQILVFGAAGLALTIGFLDKVRSFSLVVQKIMAIGGIFYLELVGLSLLVLVWYMLQAHFRYPFLYFRKIGNAWPWFYYASISEVSRRPVQLAKARFGASSSYAKDFAAFAYKALTEKPRERLRAELQQYFLLMAYSGYLHQFSLRLTDLFFYGFAGAVLSAMIFLAAVLKGAL